MKRKSSLPSLSHKLKTIPLFPPLHSVLFHSSHISIVYSFPKPWHNSHRPQSPFWGVGGWNSLAPLAAVGWRLLGHSSPTVIWPVLYEQPFIHVYSTWPGKGEGSAASHSLCYFSFRTPVLLLPQHDTNRRLLLPCWKKTPWMNADVPIGRWWITKLC